MNKRNLVIAAAVAMLVIIAAAFALDCVRLAKQARQRVDLADQELAKHEQRLIKLLNASPAISTEVKQVIADHQAATTPSARHAAYDRLIAAFRQTMQQTIDPTNVLDRKFMDDIAGAINRREVAQEPYDAEMSAYRSYVSGPRGTVARCFLAEERDDGG